MSVLSGICSVSQWEKNAIWNAFNLATNGIKIPKNARLSSELKQSIERFKSLCKEFLEFRCFWEDYKWDDKYDGDGGERPFWCFEEDDLDEFSPEEMNEIYSWAIVICNYGSTLPKRINKELGIKGE